MVPLILLIERWPLSLSVFRDRCVSMVGMDKQTSQIMSLGYEGLEIDEYIDQLKGWGVKVLIDVRLNPISRKRGFSKTKLSLTLEAAGIGYLHFRTLGNPKENRAGFAASDTATYDAACSCFRESLENEDAAIALKSIVDLARECRVALLCFEKSEKTCHRRIIRKELLEMLDNELVPTT